MVLWLFLGTRKSRHGQYLGPRSDMTCMAADNQGILFHKFGSLRTETSQNQSSLVLEIVR